MTSEDHGNLQKEELAAWSAALIKLIEAYTILAFEASYPEAQILVYFLQQAGEPIKANFTKGSYGPYDDGMKHGIQRLDGHYVLSFGDGARLDPVRLTENAAQEADDFLAGSDNAKATRERIARVARLIEGFESPYGLELLATVHWVATQEGANSAEEAIEKTRNWNPRKAKVMKPEHLALAWERLSADAWIQSA